MAKSEFRVVRETQVNTPESLLTMPKGKTVTVSCKDFSPYSTVKSAATRLNQRLGSIEFEVSTPDTSSINLATLDGLKAVQRLLGVLQLVVHHDVQHIAYALVDVVVAHAVLHRRQQPLHLARSRIADIAAGNQHPRKVGDTFHGSHVKRALEAHCLAQVGQVAADGAHGIVPKRLVVTVIVGQSGCSRRNALLQAHAAVCPHIIRFPAITVQIGTFIG